MGSGQLASSNDLNISMPKDMMDEGYCKRTWHDESVSSQARVSSGTDPMIASLAMMSYRDFVQGSSLNH